MQHRPEAHATSEGSAQHKTVFAKQFTMADDAMVIFNAVDTNKDGVLSPLELSTRLADFGMSDDQVAS